MNRIIQRPAVSSNKRALGEMDETKLKIRTPNGRLLTIEPLLFGAAAVKVTNRHIRSAIGRTPVIDFTDDEFDMGFCDEVFTYESVVKAWAAVLNWDGKGEPQGWVRHQPSNRRRSGGDPAREYVAP